MAWIPLLGAIALNYRQHKHGRATMCSITRRIIPEPVFRAAFRLGAELLEEHVAHGYHNNRT